MRKFTRNLLLVATSISAAAASAQSLPSGVNLSLTSRGAFLLLNPTFAEKLHLSLAQQTNLHGLFDRFYKRQDTYLQLGASGTDKRLLLEKDTTRDALVILTEPQRAQLFKSTVKEAGYPALVEPEIVHDLKLKSDQVHCIREVIANAEKPVLKLEEAIANQMHNDPNRATVILTRYAPGRRAARKQQIAEESKSLDFLTAPQRQKWRLLFGS